MKNQSASSSNLNIGGNRPYLRRTAKILILWQPAQHAGMTTAFLILDVAKFDGTGQ
jgi:hypothetical protein